MKKLLEYQEQHKPQIERTIIDFLIEKSNDNLNIPLYEDALKKLSEFSTSGKMIRGILVLLSSEMFGQKVQNFLNVAAAIELIHSGLLIHDDIIDDDLLRRGKTSIFAEYSHGVSKHYGQSIGICVGDLAFFLAIELIVKSDFSKDQKNEVIAFLAKELQKVAAAEMEDVHLGTVDDTSDIDRILNMYKLKSARYTFSLPLALPARIAGINQATILALEEFGENLGVVFQIVDDFLGIVGDEKITGKAVGNDIRQNKKTVFRRILYDLANKDQEVELSEIFGNEKITLDDISKVRNIAKNLGVFEKIDVLVQNLSQNAKDTLNKVDISDEHRTLLEELIEYNLHRNR